VRKAAVATASAQEGAGAPAPAGPLRRVRRIGYAILALQLAFFFAWSTILYRRFSLTLDFAVYHQAWFLIAHGNLDPYNTVVQSGFSFWRDHCEFVMWPLALFYWIWPHDVLLLWLQDAGVVVAEAVAFTWLCELAEKYRPGKDAAWLAAAGLVLLAANPWTWRSVSFDFHIEPVAVAFVALLAWDLANGRRRAWAWVVPLLACGDVAVTYLVAVGLGGVLAGRRWRLPGSVMACLGVGALLLITLIHGNRSSPVWSYTYLAGPPGASLGVGALVKGIASHPLRVLRVLWAKRWEVWTNLAPSGLLGVAFVWLLPITIVVLLPNDLAQGNVFAAPGFQTLPLYVLLPVGTVAVLGWLAVRRRNAALLLTGLLVAQALVWTAVWAPRTPAQWLRVPAPAAATLARIESRIPASAEVVASQGVVGRFSGRTDVRAFVGAGPIPLNGGTTWFVVVPRVGIETAARPTSMAFIQELTGPLHAVLVAHAHGVWAFRWRPPPGTHSITVPAGG
jgi:Predicted membrane protein (DUF2079)